MPSTEPIVTNAPEITVSELSGALKRTLEDRFGFVRVRGEISGYRGPHSSGHVYFSLKDDAARLDAIIWKTTFLRMRFKPSEGIEVIATGKITTFAGKSAYQIVVESIEPAGVGALMALLEARRKQFAAEGLFESARKRRLPFLPGTIGVVTSPSGAVIRDILHRLADRFPVRVLVWPVRVQGETSAEEVSSAIMGFNALTGGSGIPRPDVLIVARGGGSLEDLWSFNEEVVVRAAAACEIPLVSAVGHETDWTLLDQVADLRAPTPTAAAELCVPVRSELAVRVAMLAARVTGALTRKSHQDRATLRSAIRALPSAEEVLATPNQRKDKATESFKSRVRSTLSAGGLRLAGVARGLARFSPHVQLARASERALGVALRLQIVSKTSTVLARQSLKRAQDDLQRVWLRDIAERERLLLTTRQRWVLRFVDARRLHVERRLMSERAGVKLQQVALNAIVSRASRLANLAQIFGAVNYKAVLGRGYALVTDRAGCAVSGKSAARAAFNLVIKFADGEVPATVQAPPSSRRRKKQVNVTEQQSLF